MAKVKNEQIPDLNVSWENYSGASVESFIKQELRKSCGYIYRSQSREGDYYYLYGFQSVDEYLNWQAGEDVTPLFKVQLPNMDNDILAVNLSTNSNTNKLVNLGDGVKVSIRYTSTSTNPNTEVTSDTYNDGTLIITRSSNGSAFTEVGRITIQPQSNSGTAFQVVDITKYLADGDNKIRMRVEDNVNGSVSNVITFQSIINTKLVVKDATDNTKPLTSLNLSYYIEGQIEKTLHIKVTDASGSVETFDVAIGDSTYIEVPYSFLVDRQFATGIINVESWLTVDDTTLESNHISAQYFFIAEDCDESIIILNNTAKTITNYTNTKFFDFSLFNKTSDVTIVVTDGDNEYLNYTYNNCEVGKSYSFYNMLEIESSLDSISAVVKVSTKDMSSEYNVTIDNSVRMSPTEGASFVLNPKTRNNTEEAPDTIVNGTDVVSATFTNFDFSNDGWLVDSDGIGVLRIPRGRKLTIDYDPLDNLNNGTTIEFDYKVYNVYDEDNVVFKFCSYKGDMPLGFEMKATEAVFITTEKQTKRDQDIVFQDEERTHIVINIVPNLSGSGLNYIRIFINGIMNREILYTDSDIFKNGTLTMDFGADECDLDIYGIRIYKKGLSASDVRQDYMSSLPDMESKLAFRNANDIVSSNGTISYDKASVKYNTLVWTGQHPEYKTGNLKYTGNLAINIIDSPEHSGTINNMKIKGQGSSSKGYWKWNHQFDFNDDSVWTDGNGEVRGAFYQLNDDSPKARKLVSKLNWASSMQSHKMGATALYTDLWKSIVGGNSITKTQGYEGVRVSVEEKPFMYFIKDTEESTPTFAGLVTFGSGKADVATFQGDKTVFSGYLMLEGSDNGMPLTLRQIPWIEDEVTYNEDEEYFEYNGEGQLDYDLGNRDNVTYFKDAFNFAYLHSTRLKPYTEDSELQDQSYQYWNTTTYNVVRYNPISKSWVNAGITKDGDDYAVLNIKTQTSITPSNNKETDNTAFINWRKADFKAKIANYYNVNDVLYCMAFLKLIAASDNRCKNTYEYLDPITYKICMLQDDVDTIFLTDNVGRKTKPYYVEEHDKNGTSYYWNGEDNVFYNLMEEAFDVEYKAMMKSILDKMASTEFGGSAEECLDKYFFSIQKYFPSVAYNETARLLYEEASVAQANGTYKNGTPAISQSLGDQLQAEKQWWKRRLPYMQSYALSNPFYVRSQDSLGFRSTLTTESARPSYTFDLTAWQWLYPKIGVGQSMGADTTRVKAKETYTTSTINTDGNTDTFIYGANYYTSFGEFADKSIGETFELSGNRLLEFSADSRKITGDMQFRPIAMKVSCPNLRKLTLYGISTLTGNLDLSGCTKIESVDLRETKLNTVIFPSTSTLTEVCIPNLASLSITGCKSIDSFYYEDLSNLMAVTTDNNTILETVLSGATNLTEVHLEGINYAATESNSDKLYNLLIGDKSTATGSVSLAKALTLAEKNKLIQHYGNIDNKSNSLYVTYPIVSADSFEIVGDSQINQTESKEYTINYTGNDFVSVEWTVTNATYKVSGTSCTITALEDNTNNIVINCKVYRVNKNMLMVSKTITVKKLICITSISLQDYDVYETGTITIPITYTPSTYNVAINDVKARVNSNNYVAVESVDKDNVTLNCSQLVTNRIETVNLTVDVTDVKGNKVTGASQINVCKSIQDYYVDGYYLNDNPTISSKIKDGDITFTVTAGIGTDDWYVASVIPSSKTVTASVTSKNTFTLSASAEASTTVKVKIKFNNKEGEKELSFTWIAALEFDNLCFTSTGDSTIGMSYSSGWGTATLYVSRDEENWELWDYSTISLADGESVYMYGTDFQSKSSYYYNAFNIKGNIKVSGDLIALRYGSSLNASSYTYSNLFRDATITDASELVLPSRQKDQCFYGLFYNCTSLTKVPKLPATSLACGCYELMFYGCKSLVKAPVLPSVTLNQRCYWGMFENCTSLAEAPELPATSLQFRCYEEMFKGCSSLTKAPVLPATSSLATCCYDNMFAGCTKLNYVKALYTKSQSHTGWLSGVASTGTFVKNYLAEWDITGVSGIPSGWTVELNASHVSYDSLVITASNVNGRATKTTIHYSLVESFLTEDGNVVQKTWTGNGLSDTFEQNTSTTESRTLTISYTEPKSGLTATTTITQGIWVDAAYEVDLNSQWQTSDTNPDSSLYDCYESFSNYNVSNANAIMYITIVGYTEFSLYIRSYGENSYDYTVVGNLDATSITRTTSGVKATTSGKQRSGTDLASYTKVTFSNLDGAQHRIPILYGKDGSGNYGTDKGYVIIEKNQ